MSEQLRSQFDPAIQRIPLGNLVLYEITEAELDALEQGAPDPIYLNLGIGALSTASSFLVTLLTTTISDIRTFCVFVIVCSIGFIAGITFALLWLRSYRSTKNVAREIRKRKPPLGVQEPIEGARQ